MNLKLILACFTLIAVVTAASQQPAKPPAPTAPAKPLAARLLVQGTYTESYQGAVGNGNGQGKLLITFEAARWLKMSTNEVGNAEFSDLENAPAPSVSGSVSYDGRLKGVRIGGEAYDATSTFKGPLAGEDVVLGTPEYTDTGKDFKIKVFINPKLEGKCLTVASRDGQTASSTECENATFLFSPASAVRLDDNDEPGKTANTASLASFGIELDVEPEVGAVSGGASPADDAARARRDLDRMVGQGLAGDAGVYAWRGAVTSGSMETGFKITLTKTKELPSDDKRGKSVRTLNFSATIVPGIPK